MFSKIKRQLMEMYLDRLFRTVEGGDNKVDGGVSLQSDGVDDLTSSNIDYLFVAANSKDSGESASVVAGIVDIICERRWLVQDILGNVVVAIRIEAFEYKSDVDRGVLAEDIARTFGSSIKLVHGMRRVNYGCLGGRTRMVFGAQLLDVPEILGTLSKLAPGEVAEYDGA